MTLKGVSVSIPQGWKVDKQETPIQATATDNQLDLITVALFPSIGEGTQGVATSIRATQQLPASAVRPEETFDGKPFAHLTGITSGGGIYSDIYGTLLPVDGQTMLVTVTYTSDDNANSMTTDDVDAILQPVMATIRLP